MHEGPVVVVSGGGTGGHLYPALAIADEVRAIRPDVRVVFVGARRGLEARVLPERGEAHLLLPLRGIDRSRPLTATRALTGLAVGVARTFRLFLREQPEVVVVTGGYASAPAGLAAGLLGVPLVLQEQNSFPGAVTRLLTRFASRMHVAYPEAIDRLRPTGPVRVSGNPVRPPSTVAPAEARARFGLPADGTVVLVTGGSQGSVALNGVLLDTVQAVAEGELAFPDGVHVLWGTGSKHIDQIREALEREGRPSWLHPVGYFDDMPVALAAADLAVSRAGAMSTEELLNQGLPAVLVPLPSAAENHQMFNARALEAAGVAVVVPQEDLTPRVLVEALTALTEDRSRLEAMRGAALDRARPDATAEIARDVASFLPAPKRAA